MYVKYFFNVKTGQIKRVGTPTQERELDMYWVAITKDEYDRFLLAIEFATKGDN
jgi:hypothetical protein